MSEHNIVRRASLLHSSCTSGFRRSHSAIWTGRTEQSQLEYRHVPCPDLATWNKISVEPVGYNKATSITTLPQTAVTAVRQRQQERVTIRGISGTHTECSLWISSLDCLSLDIRNLLLKKGKFSSSICKRSFSFAIGDTQFFFLLQRYLSVGLFLWLFLLVYYAMTVRSSRSVHVVWVQWHYQTFNFNFASLTQGDLRHCGLVYTLVYMKCFFKSRVWNEKMCRFLVIIKSSFSISRSAVWGAPPSLRYASGRQY